MVMIIMIRYQRSCIRWCRQPVLDCDHGHQDNHQDGDDDGDDYDDDYDNDGDDNHDEDQNDDDKNHIHLVWTHSTS